MSEPEEPVAQPSSQPLSSLKRRHFPRQISTDSLYADGADSSPRSGPGGSEQILSRQNSSNSMQTDQMKVASQESKLKKMATRTFFGFIMIFLFMGIVWAGHLYVCMLVVVLQSMVFKEMVNVRYRAAQEKEIPLFRTLQWSWFAVAIFYTYGDFLHDFCISHEPLLWLSKFTKWHGLITFNAYSGLFVLSVLTLKKGLYRYQVGQLTWTIVTILMIVAQLKFVAHNIFNGMFWFFFPCSMVVANDCFAYFCGMSLGRKIIKAPFLKISPNKTWEGFIGGLMCTFVYAWYSSKALSQYEWFICPVDDLSLYPKALHCQPNSVFLLQDVTVPVFGRIWEWAQRKFIEGTMFGSDDVIEGESNGDVAFTLHVLPIQCYSLIMATFVSLIAPFGGFWASAIKRAYGIKDFDSIIPGHGGVTDRMDCQFITALFVFVFYDAFIRPSMVTVGGLLTSASLLSLQEQQELYDGLGRLLESRRRDIGSGGGFFGKGKLAIGG